MNIWLLIILILYTLGGTTVNEFLKKKGYVYPPIVQIITVIFWLPLFLIGAIFNKDNNE